MKLFQSFFLSNPMMAETRHAFRASLPGGKIKVSARFTPFFIVVAALLVIMNILLYGENMPPELLTLGLMLGMVTIIPLNIHGVISGEREKRSLELLLVTPVTTGQIIVGKWMRGAWLVVTLIIVYLFFALATMAAHFQHTPAYLATGFENDFLMLFLGAVFGLVVAFFASSWTVLVSSCTKSIGASLVTTLGSLFAYFILWPGAVSMFLYSIRGNNPQVMVLLNPFIAVFQFARNQAPERYIELAVLNYCLHFAMSFLFLYLAYRRLNVERVGSRKYAEVYDA